MSSNAKRFKSDEYDDPEDLPVLYSIFKGEVASVRDYGIFVKIPGCRKHGLVHVSQMSTSRVDKASDVCEAGEKVYCKVTSLESQGSKISLSMKVVNQSTGQDLDPNQVQSSQESQRRKTGFQRDIPRIELGAIFDTTCKKCGGKGHLAQDCFHKPGETAYELIEDKFEWPKAVQTATCPDVSTKSKDKHKHKKEKKKKHKKEKKKEKDEKHSKSKRDKHSSHKKLDPSSEKPHHHHHRLSSHDDSESAASNKNCESRKHSN